MVKGYNLWILCAATDNVLLKKYQEDKDHKKHRLLVSFLRRLVSLQKQKIKDTSTYLLSFVSEGIPTFEAFFFLFLLHKNNNKHVLLTLAPLLMPDAPTNKNV